MITDRWLEDDDYEALVSALTDDEFHQGTTPEFFVQPGTLTRAYCDEAGPILFVRGAKCLRLDIQFCSTDGRRNLKAMLAGFPKVEAQAKANGFSEIIFNSVSPGLIAFCKKKFGFVESDGELRKLLP